MTFHKIAMGKAVLQALNDGRRDEAEMLMEFLLARRNETSDPVTKFDTETIELLLRRIKVERGKHYLAGFMQWRGHQ